MAKATCATIGVRAAGLGHLTAFAHRGPRRVIAPTSRVSPFTTSGETAVVRLAVAGATVPQIATFTGHSLSDVEAILDAHYLGRDIQVAEAAVLKLEKRTKL